MPRKQFLADLKDAQASPLPNGFQAMDAGADDGQFELSWDATDMVVQITVILSDVSDYPASHEYMIFCSENASPAFAQKLNDIQRTSRKSVLQLLELLSAELSKSPPDGDMDLKLNDYDPDGDPSEEMEDEDMSEIEDDDDDFDTFLTGAPPTRSTLEVTGLGTLSSNHARRAAVDPAFSDRLRTDLQATKEAGFRVAVIGDLSNGSSGFLAVSTRIAKLGISDEAMLAWQVDPSDYLMLLIYYSSGYSSLEELQGVPNMASASLCTMRIFVSKSYKPTRDEAIIAFQKGSENDKAIQSLTEADVNDNMPNLKMTFLSRPFIRLLNEDLVSITRFRDLGMDWAGAEAWYRDREGSIAHGNVPDEYFVDERNKTHYPAIVTEDHYKEGGRLSFPLVAMQFTLRHFVRCTEFCVVCHRKVSAEIEAIKPYVCERPLCLFQYMAMGFGPSIEHEILSQPYVVDLLISFCYAAAMARKLKELPTGLGIKVPSTKAIAIDRAPAGFQAYIANVHAVEDIGPDVEEFDIGFDRARQEIQFLDRPRGGCPVAKGSWVVIRIPQSATSGTEVLHCRVSETNFFPIIMVDKPVCAASATTHIESANNGLQDTGYASGIATPATKPNWTPCTLRRHDIDFDTLTREQKCDAICQLLLVIPTVKDMQAYLKRSTAKDLKLWVERIPASALQLLQWIIASNRACLMQVDDRPPGAATEAVSTDSRQDRLYGMPGYMQFRFAMGAPDKEERFLSEVQATTHRLKLKYPTIFAWHGSPIYNWHMIIREGLHYQNKDHGRAYGDGVYHALDANTSLGYCSRGGPSIWPNSILKLSSAIALNELVNAPTEYRSSSPYYVVQQLDWIQTRYLLVQCDTDSSAVNTTQSKEFKPAKPHPQDPSRTPRGKTEPIVVPSSAIKTGKQNHTDEIRSSSKRLKTNAGGSIAMESDSDMHSVVSDEEDLAAFSSQTNQTKHGATSVTDGCARIALSEEDFVPGQLDIKTLPLMPLPTYATSSTTQCLMKELRRLQKTLDTTPQRELGWHVDTSAVDNVYQWIVELHSFHTFTGHGKRLPMADDMKRKKIKSVVLEVRFGADFPFSPPYVRVVRPRFLSFNQGGGGHIVMGGAMCMELLTNTGWIGSSSMESVLMQVRLAMASEPYARLDERARGDYAVGEAADGFIRACRTHGWTVPPGFQAIAYGMPTTENLGP